MGELNNVSMQQQRNDQWCWAAVTSCVAGALQNRVLTQEDVVCQVLMNNNCNLSPTPDECNIPVALEVALGQVCGCAVNLLGQIPFASIQNQIDGVGRPLPIAVAFTGPFGFVIHYCIIKGYNTANGEPEVILLDPAHALAGESLIHYSALCDGSAMGGPWVESFVI
jgi:hypothetical protein